MATDPQITTSCQFTACLLYVEYLGALVIGSLQGVETLAREIIKPLVLAW